MSPFITTRRRFLPRFSSRSTSSVSRSCKKVRCLLLIDWSNCGYCVFVKSFCFPFQDLEFKIIYVGSAETVEFDQTLDQIVVDAVPKGQFKFMFQVCNLPILVAYLYKEPFFYSTNSDLSVKSRREIIY